MTQLPESEVYPRVKAITKKPLGPQTSSKNVILAQKCVVDAAGL